jgi:hypothetical protein
MERKYRLVTSSLNPRTSIIGREGIMKIRDFIETARRGLFTCAIVGLTTAASHASAITWGSPQNISGDSDVDTTGSLVGAFNIGVSGVGSTTINGVTFAGLALTGSNVTSGNFNLTIATSFAGNNSVGFAAAPFNTLSAAYQGMLSTEAGDFTNPITLTMSGLTPGNTYEFEWWKNVSNGFESHTATATAGNAVSLNSNTSAGATGGIGQFALGTFVADATTSQTITFSSTVQDTFNGFQLRTGAVPEPTALSLAGLGLLVAVGRRRRSN